MINKKSNLFVFFLISILLHFFVMSFFLFFTKEPKVHLQSQETVISFSTLPISEKTNVKTQEKQLDKITEDLVDAKKSKEVLHPEQKSIPEPLPELEQELPKTPEAKNDENPKIEAITKTNKDLQPDLTQKAKE